jgi:hypothetical protein
MSSSASGRKNDHPGNASHSNEIVRGRVKKAKVGRKPLLMNEAKIGLLADAFAAGNSIRNACGMAGVGVSTYHRWMAEFERAGEGSLIREFRDRIKKAQAEAEHRNVLLIQKAATTRWQAAAWWLERHRPEHWGRMRRMP